jgi:hypothetical protein
LLTFTLRRLLSIPPLVLVVSLLTTGKPIVGGHIVPLLTLLRDLGRVFPKVVGGGS